MIRHVDSPDFFDHDGISKWILYNILVCPRKCLSLKRINELYRF